MRRQQRARGKVITVNAALFYAFAIVDSTHNIPCVPEEYKPHARGWRKSLRERLPVRCKIKLQILQGIVEHLRIPADDLATTHQLIPKEVISRLRAPMSTDGGLIKQLEDKEAKWPQIVDEAIKISAEIAESRATPKLYPTQKHAQDAVKAQLGYDSEQTFENVVIVDYTLDYTYPFLEEMLKVSKHVIVIVGKPADAMQLSSTTQERLLHAMEHKLFAGEFKPFIDSKQLLVVQHSLPIGIRGFNIDDKAYCMGWAVWWPVWQKSDGEIKVEIKDPSKKPPTPRTAFTHPRETKDPICFNGHQMPHAVVYDGDGHHYRTIKHIFDLYVEGILATTPPPEKRSR